MLTTHMNLECEDCRNPFPACGNFPAPVDGAIYTPAMLRAEAKEEGWKRPVVLGARIDLCPRCAKIRCNSCGEGSESVGTDEMSESELRSDLRKRLGSVCYRTDVPRGWTDICPGCAAARGAH